MTEGFEHQLREFAGDYQETNEAIDELLSLGGNSFEALTEMVNQSEIEAELRSVICWLFRRFDDQRAVPALIEALSDNKAEVRHHAAIALADLRPKEAVTVLSRVLVEHEDHQTRSLAAYALGQIGEADSWALFIEQMMDTTEVPSMRGHIIEALTYLEVEASRSIPYLLRLLENEAAEARFWACYALGEFGDETVIPELEALAEKDQSVVLNWWSVRKEALDSANYIRERMKYRDGE